MTNWNLNQHVTQTTGLDVMIGRCSLDSQDGGTNGILRMFAALFSGTQIILLSGTQTINKSTIHTRHHCLENGQWKITNKHYVEIWTEFGKFKTTNQRLADQVRTITKNGWFYDLEILEIHQEIYRQAHQQTPITENQTINTGKSKTPN